MTRTLVEALPHDLAIIAALETLSRPVGFAEAPKGALKAVQLKTGPDYLILYPISSNRDGSLGDAWAEADFSFQVTCVGREAAGVRWLVGRIEYALLGVTVSGRVITQVVVEDDGAVRPDFDVDPPVLVATPRYRISSVPT